MNSIEFFYKSRQNYDFSSADSLSSGNNLFPPLSFYNNLLKGSSFEKFYWGDYQEAGGHVEGRKYIAQAINSEHGIDYYSSSNVFVSLGTTDAIDIVTLFAKTRLKSNDAFYMLPCYYLFNQSAMNYGYNMHFSHQLEYHYNDDFLDMLKQAPQYSLVYLNNPNSLSGITLSEQFLLDVFSIIKSNHLYCIFDEITGRAPLNNGVYSIIDLANQENCLDQVFITCSVSKEISLPGVRAGFLLAPQQIGPEIEHFFRQRYGAIPVFISNFIISYFKIQSALKNDEDVIIGDTLFDNEKRFQYQKEKKAYQTLCTENINYLFKLKESHGFDFLYPEYGQSLFISKTAKKLDYWKYVERSVLDYNLDVSFGPFFGGTLECWSGYKRVYARINFSNNKTSFRHVASMFSCFLDTIE
ncbi:MAG: pyridoxal phosphate-dependent aminotransferase [Bacteroidales bacterium]|nr:pyridoxal phosphate-dependent aminotransferase [Bacteroidales bacterium]